LENPGCPYPGQPTFSGTGDIYIEKTYVGGIGQKVKYLLDAEELAGNRNGLRGQDISRIASSRSFGQFLFLESAVSILSASFHLMQCSLRDPRLLSLFVSTETRPSSSGVSKKLGLAAALPK
jgi:hypothetical protein